MPQGKLDVVRALIPQGRDIAPLFRDERAYARAREVLDPLVTDDFENVVVVPGQTRTRRGTDGMRGNWLDWLEPWATYRVSIDELKDSGDRVLALTRHFGRRKDMEAEVEMIAAVIMTFRDGRVMRWEDYAERDVALDAWSAHTSTSAP
jgi:ketosteroid isomerase-like protein